MKMVLTLMIMVSDSRLAMCGMTFKWMLSREVRLCLVMSGRPELLRDCAGNLCRCYILCSALVIETLQGTKLMDSMDGVFLSGSTDIKGESQTLK